LNYALLGLFYRIGGTDPGAYRIMAVHADLWGSLNAVGALNGFQVDHRAAAMSVAFLAGLDASLASYAARVVDEKGEPVHLIPPACGSSRDMASSGELTFEILTAQILNSGMLEIGSIALMVQLLAARSSGQ